MTYDEFIQNIIDTRGRFNIPDGEYKERHHIIPKCMNGSNDEENLIDLYAREHYEAHRLLALENTKNIGLQRAWWMMACMSKDKDGILTAEEYEQARIFHIEHNKGENSPNWGKRLTEEHKLKISLKVRGCLNPMYGKTHSEETKQKIRVANSGVNAPNYGKHFSAETKRKIKEAHPDFSNENNPAARAVMCVETQEVFPTAKQAAESIHRHRAGITHCCQHLQKNLWWLSLGIC